MVSNLQARAAVRAQAKEDAVPEAVGEAQETAAAVVQPKVPAYLLKAQSARPWPHGFMENQKDGFITITLPETRDPMGAEPRSFCVGTQHHSDRVTLYRGVPVAVPLRLAAYIEGRKRVEVKLVPNPVFDQEFTDKEQVPNFVSTKIPKIIKHQIYTLGKRTPEDWEVGLALTRFPHDATELKECAPEAFSKYTAAWEAEFIRRQKAKRPSA